VRGMGEELGRSTIYNGEGQGAGKRAIHEGCNCTYTYIHIHAHTQMDIDTI